jgi:SAM-dependent methyltransferase
MSVPPPPGEDGYFDEAVADRYDEESPELGSMFSDEAISPVVERLIDLAHGKAILEFAIGTGRIALPLAARGVNVHGIELSRAMVRRMRGKPGGDAISVAIGDMATTRIEGEFGLVYLVFNSIGNVTTREGQVAVFRNAAAHLASGGRFVIELVVPNLQRLPPGARFVVDATDSHWGIDEYDVVSQGLVSHHFELVSGQWQLTSLPFRYAWPEELDSMADAAGMRLEHRWSDWSGSPFTAESRQHVSVWEKLA